MDEFFEEVSLQELNNLISRSSQILKCEYNGKTYEANFINSTKYINLISLNPINSLSEKMLKGYSTLVAIDDTSKIIMQELYALYKNNLFKVLYSDENVAYLEVDYQLKQKLDDNLIKSLEFNRDFNSNPYLKINSTLVDKYIFKKKYYKNESIVDYNGKIK